MDDICTTFADASMDSYMHDRYLCCRSIPHCSRENSIFLCNSPSVGLMQSSSRSGGQGIFTPGSSALRKTTAKCRVLPSILTWYSSSLGVPILELDATQPSVWRNAPRSARAASLLSVLRQLQEKS